MRGAIWLAVSAFALLSAVARAQYDLDSVTPADPGQGRLRVVVHPYDGKRLVAAAGEGVYVSSDGGASWRAPRGAPQRALNGRLFADPARPGVVFLEQPARSFVPLVGPPHVFGGRLYRSTDFGESWSLVVEERSGPASEYVALVVMPTAVDPRDPLHLYGTRRQALACRVGCFGGDLDLSLHESRDGGSTWGPSLANLGGFGLQHVSYPTPGAPERLFAIATDLLPYISVDSGRSWQRFAPGFSHTLFWVEQDPQDARIIYAAGTVEGPAHVVARSEDGGASWRTIHRAPDRHFEVARLTIDPSRTGRVWLSGLAAGLLLSEDAGRTWSSIGFAVAEASRSVERVVPSPADAPQVYVVQDRKLYRAMAGPTSRVAVEYRYGDRYWLSGDRGEIVSQDFRAYEAIRTGQKFGLWSRGDAPADAKGMCRFQGNPSFGQTSRFVALDGFECDIVKAIPSFVLEGEGEYFAVPPTEAGACAADLLPVRRFNNKQPNVNHRYVASGDVAAQMRAAGWIDEGVRFCARPLGSDE